MSRPSSHSIVGIGEVLWDLLPTGAKLGGAPCNFACHASQLGAMASIVSCVGEDDLGTRATNEIRERGVNVDAIGQCERDTGTVEVTLDVQGHPNYRILPDVAWDYLTWSESLAALASATDAVCFGTLGQRHDVSRQTIRRFLSATPQRDLRLLDINLRPPFFDDTVILESLRLANVLKLSDEELPLVARACGLTGEEDELLEQLAEQFKLQAIALTCGSRGATILGEKGVSQHQPTAVKTVDTIGAGDSYTAALAVGLLADLEYDTINAAACRIAGYVCTQAGATPELPAELRSLLVPSD